MRLVGFTGARELSANEEVVVERILYRITADKVITGACTGLDEFVATFFATRYPDVHQMILVPSNKKNVTASFIELMMEKPNVDVVFMPEGSSYAYRNFEIVKNSKILVGFPRFPESDPRMRRSGTWQTIRMGHESNLNVSVHLLDSLVRGE
jgi:hypothetical protein